MRILLIANYLRDAQKSMQLYAELMFDVLTAGGHEVRVSRPQPLLGSLKASNDSLAKWLGYFDKFAIFPRSLKKDLAWAEIVHICDHSNALYVRHLNGKPHVVTCHDLLAVRSALGEISENPTSWTGRQLQRLILSGLKQSDHLVCVSDATRKDVLRLASLPHDRVSRVYSAINYSYSPMCAGDIKMHLERLSVKNQNFILHVGGNQWYKNRVGTIEIFRHLLQHEAFSKCQLLMVGKPWTRRMQKFVEQNGLTQKVRELINVPEESLRALYSSAKLLLFPSLEEGFGWPILEAQACGCPVVTTNKAPMSEISGGAAILIDPTDPGAAARKIASVSNLSGYREAGLKNVIRFSRSAMTEQYVEIYRRILQ